MSMLQSTFDWLKRKRYQYEVTFSLYMLTPTEKFIFNSFLFLFFSMVIIAMTLYLPQHIAFLTNRAWFYYHGDEDAMVQGVKSVIENVASTSTAIVQQVKETLAQAGVDSTVVGVAKEL